MATITVYDRNSSRTFRYDLEKTDTIADVKKMISGENTLSACITFHGKILNDRTPLGALSSGDVTLFIEKITEDGNREEEEIEFSKIEDECEECLGKEKEVVTASEEPIVNQPEETRVSEILERVDKEEAYEVVKIDGKEVKARASEIYVVDRKRYYITGRLRKFTLKYLQEKLGNFFTSRTVLLHFLILMFIIQTNNIFLQAVILSIRILRLLSSICLRTRVWQRFTGHFSKAVFMFFASLFLLDHGSFYPEKSS